MLLNLFCDLASPVRLGKQNPNPQEKEEDWPEEGIWSHGPH